MPRHLQHLRRIFQRELLVRPLSRREFGNLPVCGLGDAGEHVAQILMRIDTASAATFDNRVAGEGSVPRFIAFCFKNHLIP